MPLTGTLASASARGYGLFASALVTGNYYSIQTATVDSGGASSITFSSIPSTYTHLQVRGFWQSNRNDGIGVDDAYMTVNGDTTGSYYATHFFYGNGSTASAAAVTADGRGIDIGYTSIGTQNGNGSTPSWGGFVMDILDYTNSNKSKVFRIMGGSDMNGTGGLGLGGRVGLISGLWTQTTAVSSLTFTAYSPRSFNQYSQIALYGVK
jgi:hypothetical protein